MINFAVKEGYVAGRPWHRDGDLYFRMAIYRDSHVPPKRVVTTNGALRDEPDYVTAVMPQSLFNISMVDIQRGYKIRVRGFTTSVDTQETLEEWLRGASGPLNSLTITDEQRRECFKKRSLNFLLIQEVQNIEKPSNNDLATTQSSKAAPAGAPSKPAGGNGKPKNGKPPLAKPDATPATTPAPANTPTSVPTDLRVVSDT
jgi:hypothetical protein